MKGFVLFESGLIFFSGLSISVYVYKIRSLIAHKFSIRH